MTCWFLACMSFKFNQYIWRERLVPQLCLLLALNSYWRGRNSTIDLLVLTSLDNRLLILKSFFLLFNKTSYINKVVNCTEYSPSMRVPWLLGWVAQQCPVSCIFAQLAFPLNDIIFVNILNNSHQSFSLWTLSPIIDIESPK